MLEQNKKLYLISKVIMSKNIYLFWFKIEGTHGNFGDELNPYILGKLTGKKIIYISIADTRIKRIYKGLKRLLKKQISSIEVFNIIRSIIAKNCYVAIGSIIGMVGGGKSCHVWGTGIMRKNSQIKNANFHAVRGELTRKRIQELGYKSPKALGDPALLLPLIYYPNNTQIYELGIIPHYVQKEEFMREFTTMDKNILIIDLLDDVENVIKQITSCKYVISSSLHGIIVSHAYGIPSLWCNLGNNLLAGDDSKFQDYFSSVKIPNYEKLQLRNDIDLIEQSRTFFNTFPRNSKINNDLRKIQRELILNAPFNVLGVYKEKVGLS